MTLLKSSSSNRQQQKTESSFSASFLFYNKIWIQWSSREKKSSSFPLLGLCCVSFSWIIIDGQTLYTQQCSIEEISWIQLGFCDLLYNLRLRVVSCISFCAGNWLLKLSDNLARCFFSLSLVLCLPSFAAKIAFAIALLQKNCWMSNCATSKKFVRKWKAQKKSSMQRRSILLSHIFHFFWWNCTITKYNW